MNRIALLIIFMLLILGGIVGYSLTHYKAVQPVTVNPVLSISAFNLTKNANAVSVAAMPGDEIAYSVSVENHSEKVIRGFVIQLDLLDLSELAALVNATGGNYNTKTGILAWTPLDIQAYSAREKKFIVKINKNFLAGSDLIMSVKYNNNLRVSVTGPSKVVAVGVRDNQVMGSSVSQNDFQAPLTGPENIFEMIGAVFITLLVFIKKLFNAHSVLV